MSARLSTKARRAREQAIERAVLDLAVIESTDDVLDDLVYALDDGIIPHDEARDRALNRLAEAKANLDHARDGLRRDRVDEHGIGSDRSEAERGIATADRGTHDALDLLAQEIVAEHFEAAVEWLSGDVTLDDVMIDRGDGTVADGGQIVAQFRNTYPNGEPAVFVSPEIDVGETTATCSVCGVWGIVPDDPQVVNADHESRLICDDCGGEQA